MSGPLQTAEGAHVKNRQAAYQMEIGENITYLVQIVVPLRRVVHASVVARVARVRPQGCIVPVGETLSDGESHAQKRYEPSVHVLPAVLRNHETHLHKLHLPLDEPVHPLVLHERQRDVLDEAVILSTLMSARPICTAFSEIVLLYVSSGVAHSTFIVRGSVIKQTMTVLLSQRGQYLRASKRERDGVADRQRDGSLGSHHGQGVGWQQGQEGHTNKELQLVPRGVAVQLGAHGQPSCREVSLSNLEPDPVVADPGHGGVRVRIQRVLHQVVVLRNVEEPQGLPHLKLGAAAAHRICDVARECSQRVAALVSIQAADRVGDQAGMLGNVVRVLHCLRIRARGACSPERS